ncbi:sensor histidine kinase [Nucisporomicrobium flavum]|jgi:signal transduction histidine kinase|uniref:sensor histidine kinase n=1 Tax=Nucisporomicrobium flavum TaxID=2785915 RepID=UPI0018F369FD|nr:HAMP domain-containing sensor histidine kinase [Nucisporomicrobium flavum]
MRLKLTIRGRLTLVYGGLFLLAGLVMLGVTYVLVSRQLPTGVAGLATSVDVQRTRLLDGSEPDVVFRRAVEITRDDALSALLTQGGIALLVVGAAAVALGWLVAGRMLQPLHQITDTARRIAEAPAADRGLHERIALKGPDDEMKRLADTFDVMLARLDRSFDGQRRFIANASHELRTPLTLNRTLLEVALEKDASPEVTQLGTTLLAINQRHGRLIDGLLLLARSERELTERSYVDLADIVEHAAADDVKTDLAEAATLGDPVLLERLVQNLLDNAARHNLSSGGWVRVSTATHNGWATLQVANSGPVVPRYEVASLLEPFRRLTGTDRLAGSGGAGLGLSIVRAVARAHGGDVHLEPRDEGGLVVTVALPAAQAWS